MQFLTFDQAQLEPFRLQYRYSAVNSFLAWLACFAIAAGCAFGAFQAWTGGAWIGVFILGWCGFWFGLFALLTWSVFKARRLPTNWLVRVQTDGLLVKYRTYLNHHFPSEDMTVVYMPFAEIEWVREHRVQRNIPGAVPGNDMRNRFKYAEFKLPDQQIRELDNRLASERLTPAPKGSRWFGNAQTSSPHYPVQVVKDGLVRVEWGVRPKLQAFLAEIGNFVQVKPQAGTSVDYRLIAGMPKAEQEQRLLELVESGDRMGAVKVAKLLYGYNTTEAVKFVNEFSGRQTSRL